MIESYENKAVKADTIKIKLNVPLNGKPEGFVVRVKTDKEGTPLDRYWRDRLKDAKIDNCVETISEVITEKKTNTRKKTETEGVEK